MAPDFDAINQALNELKDPNPYPATKALIGLAKDVVSYPGLYDYRKYKSSSTKLSKIIAAPGGEYFLKCWGWQREGDYWVLPVSVKDTVSQYVYTALKDSLLPEDERKKKQESRRRQEEKKAAKGESMINLGFCKFKTPRCRR